MSQIVIVNGGESPLASKIKKGDATKAEEFAMAGSSLNNGGAAPAFDAKSSKLKPAASISDDIVLATGKGVARARSGAKKS